MLKYLGSIKFKEAGSGGDKLKFVYLYSPYSMADLYFSFPLRKSWWSSPDLISLLWDVQIHFVTAESTVMGICLFVLLGKGYFVCLFFG